MDVQNRAKRKRGAILIGPFVRMRMGIEILCEGGLVR